MELESLARMLHEASPTDRVELARLHEALKELRARAACTTPEESGRMDAAVLLTGFMSRTQDELTEEDLEVVVRLVQPGGIPDEPSPAKPERTPGADLRLVSDVLLGDVLLQMGIVAPSQLEEALRVQLRTRQPLGRVLTSSGAITLGQLDRALALQVRLKRGRDDDLEPAEALRQARQRRDYHEAVGDCLLGETLLRMGRITQEQLDRALAVQKATGMRIGEALVEIRAVTWTQLERLLQIQVQRRSR